MTKHQRGQNLGDTIRQRRHAAGLSTRELARRSGIGDATVRRIEHGQSEAPLRRTLKAIDNALERAASEPAGWTKLSQRDLPPLIPYLRTRYPDLPPRAVNELADYLEFLTTRFGDPAPVDGADER